MSPKSKCRQFAGCSDRLVPGHCVLPLLVAELREAKAVELLSVWVYRFICMDSMDRKRDDRICGNGHAVGKGEWTQREAHRHHLRSRRHQQQSSSGKKLAYRCSLRQCVGSPVRSYRACASCPVQLSSNLPPPRQLQRLGGEVPYIQGGREGGTIPA